MPKDGDMPQGKVQLRVKVLGNVAIFVCVDGVEKPLKLGNRKSRAVLGVLAMHDQRTISRERLAGLLWGAKEQLKAQGNLRNALYEVRRALIKHGLGAFINEDLDRHTITIDHSLVDTDLTEVMTALGKGRVHDLLLERERLFEGLFDDLKRVDDEFEAWVVTKRTGYGRRAHDQVEDLMRSKKAAMHTRELAARALSNLDPSNEEAVRLRMRLLAERGDSGAALTLYLQLETYLDEQLGSEPSLPTINLNAAIKMGQIAVTDSGEPPPPLPPEPTLQLAPGERLVIGVCTFDSAGISENLRPYVSGFRTDLIGSLVQFREWDIYEPKRLWAPATWPRGKNGEYVIAASAIEADGAVRLTLSLHDLETQKVVDTQQVHLSRENWFKSQDDVIRKLAQWLNLNISEERIKAFGKATKEHPALAYDIWLKHERHKQLFTPEQWFHAETALLELIGKYPDFDRAYASLAASYNIRHYVFPGTQKNAELFEKALDLSLIAIRLNPRSAHGQRAVAYSYALLGAFELARYHFNLALELNENDDFNKVSALAGLGVCGSWGDVEEPLRSVIFAIKNPTEDMLAYQAFNAFAVGSLDRAMNLAARAPQVTFARAIEIAARSLSGDISSARDLRRELFQSIKRRWASNRAASDENIVDWIVAMQPAPDERVRDDFKAGLLLALDEQKSHPAK